MNPPDLSRKTILLVNDDGIDAEGIQALRHEMADVCNLLVVAPLTERSGSGCGLTVDREIAVEKREENGRVWGYAVDGTPADCVKFALVVLGNKRPDLVLSGVNRGSNVGNSVWYSGTVAGAMEATLLGLRAFAVSLSYEGIPSGLHFETGARITRELVPWLLTQPWEPRTLWNLNVPNLPFEEVDGVRCTYQGTSFFVDNFTLERTHNGREIYRNVGQSFELTPDASWSDDQAVARGSASLTLLDMDLSVRLPPTARQALEREWNQLVFSRPGIKDPASR